jgi:hypothetical protein
MSAALLARPLVTCDEYTSDHIEHLGHCTGIRECMSWRPWQGSYQWSRDKQIQWHLMSPNGTQSLERTCCAAGVPSAALFGVTHEREAVCNSA